MSRYAASYTSALYEALGNMAVWDREGIELEHDVALEQLSELSATCKRNRGIQYFCGNGASAAFASHMALDWSKNGGVRSVAFNDPVLMSAIGNDVGLDELFARPLAIYGSNQDVLVTVSSSGNSPNILRVIEQARELSMSVVTLSGLNGDNKSRRMGDLNLYVPAKTYGIVECAHQAILHMWLDHFLGLAEWEREDVQNMREDSLRL